MMPEVPIITREHLSKPNALIHLLKQYSTQEQRSILRQLLKPALLKQFPEGKNGIHLIAKLVQFFPDKKRDIAIKIFDLNTLKIFVQSHTDIQALIELFPESKNDLAHRVFILEIFELLATQPDSIELVINLFPELHEYIAIISDNLGSNKTQLIQSIVRCGMHKVVELCRVFENFPKTIQQIAKEILKNDETFNLLIQNVSDVHELIMIPVLKRTVPEFQVHLAKKIIENQKLDTLIQSSEDAEALTHDLPCLKDDIASSYTCGRRFGA